MNIVSNAYVKRGYVGLFLMGKFVWSGPINAPWEDVECDKVVMNPLDFDNLKGSILERKP